VENDIVVLHEVQVELEAILKDDGIAQSNWLSTRPCESLADISGATAPSHTASKAVEVTLSVLRAASFLCGSGQKF
jgi:hypothetical protein